MFVDCIDTALEMQRVMARKTRITKALTVIISERSVNFDLSRVRNIK